MTSNDPSRAFAPRFVIWFILVTGLLTLSGGRACAQTTPAADDHSSRPAPDDPVATMFHHSTTSRYWVSGQDNVIFQYHPSFDAKYSGANSLHSHGEGAISHVSTLYLGYALTHTTEVFFDTEDASGGGISDALGAGRRNESGCRQESDAFEKRLIWRE